jgi:site-specific recombinase XerD
MKKPTDLALRLTHFLGEYLPAQRSVSPNTIKSYRDAFTLLLRYCQQSLGVAIERLTLDRLDAQFLLGFLKHLEDDRGSCGATRNQRLAALHSFFRYLQVEDPARMGQCQRILAIPMQKVSRKNVGYLEGDEMATILKQPAPEEWLGRRDQVLLAVLYDTGARVQELADLQARDVRLEAPAQIKLTGKGRKTRVIPLMSNTITLLRRHLREQGLDVPDRADRPLFVNRSGGKLTRSGIAWILGKHVGRARAASPGLYNRISPHTLRHYSESLFTPSDLMRWANGNGFGPALLGIIKGC